MMNHTILFISQDSGLSAALSCYFRYVHGKDLITITFDYQEFSLPQIPLASTIVVQNEVFINNEIFTIYPFWFRWGKRNKIRVYGFSFENTNMSSGILNWEDFLNLTGQRNLEIPIAHQEISYPDSTASILKGIIKPHGGDSLADLSAKLHYSFVDISRRFKNKYISESSLMKIKTIFIDKGTKIFSEFQEKEKRYHSFLSLLPGSQELFTTIHSLKESIEGLNRIDFKANVNPENLISRFKRTEEQVKSLDGFFKDLEQSLKGD